MLHGQLNGTTGQRKRRACFGDGILRTAGKGTKLVFIEAASFGGVEGEVSEGKREKGEERDGRQHGGSGFVCLLLLGDMTSPEEREYR